MLYSVINKKNAQGFFYFIHDLVKGHEDNRDNVTILYLTLQLNFPRAHKMSSFHVCDDFKISKIS